MTERELRRSMSEYLDFLSRATPQGGSFMRFLESRKFTGFRKFDRLETAEFHSMLKAVSAQPKQCYFNSQQASIMSCGQWKYYEGWCISEKLPVPLEHSWNVLSHQVLDLTLNPVTHRDSSRSDRVFYCGVNIPLELVKNEWFKKKKPVARALLSEFFSDSMQYAREPSPVQ